MPLTAYEKSALFITLVMLMFLVWLGLFVIAGAFPK